MQQHINGLQFPMKIRNYLIKIKNKINEKKSKKKNQKKKIKTGTVITSSVDGQTLIKTLQTIIRRR